MDPDNIYNVLPYDGFGYSGEVQMASLSKQICRNNMPVLFLTGFLAGLLVLLMLKLLKTRMHPVMKQETNRPSSHISRTRMDLKPGT